MVPVLNGAVAAASARAIAFTDADCIPAPDGSRHSWRAWSARRWWPARLEYAGQVIGSAWAELRRVR